MASLLELVERINKGELIEPQQLDVYQESANAAEKFLASHARAMLELRRSQSFLHDVLSAWTPQESLPHEPGGRLASEIAWTALDCPSSFAAVPAGSPPHVLGRLEGWVHDVLSIGEELIVLAWPLGHEGRKRWAATAILGPDGRLSAHARATWIALSA